MTRSLSQGGSLATPSEAVSVVRRSPDSTVARYLAAFRGRLDSGQEDAVLAIIGDSTGNGDGVINSTEARWPWLFTQRLAALYPDRTVIFRQIADIPTAAYDAGTTVQTGTGIANAGVPYKLTIYNGSASGMNPIWSQSHLNTLIPVTPHLVIINHGHNQGGATDDNVNVAFYALIRDILRLMSPNVPVLVMGQNPQRTGTLSVPANMPLHLQRMNRLREMCGTEGWGFLDVTRAFLDIPNWDVTATFVKDDGIHPASPAGNLLWVDTLWACYMQAKYASPSANPARADRIFLPATEFVPSLILGGSPVAAVLNSFLPVLSFTKQAGVAGASTIVHLPGGWKSANVWAWWTTTDGVAGNVAWQIDRTYLSRINFDTSNGSNAVAMTMATGAAPVAGVAPTAAFAEAHTLVSPYWSMIPSTAPMMGPRHTVIRVGRSGGNAADTYAGTAHLYGVILERCA
ncbi:MULTISPECIES: SGNH/GDSL hydrolase family protein [unclassified Cryobacterium]|uniref:SGNH/GDSL hydrolase family protein n=1 Tax=unclassified Cryobacterium TaxID=2649013 RepID=UPI00106A9003|nr:MULTISPECIES: SGNH/GDSL hydrolase family protein [unclassified Cryobacterium]TFB96511.1 SGNH/GDSL hydrolase family protein [Cryobacterium sp. MDB2-A-1]TFC12796.1 SGNH/GDSL hydrolase family protein [Cryobacterium sp. MDB2-A-2]